MATKTIFVTKDRRREDDDDSMALWVILLVAFGVVMIAIVGMGKADGPAERATDVTRDAGQGVSRAVNP